MIARSKRMSIVAAASFAALLVAGCGDSEDNGGEASAADIKTASLSKPQFVERANSACSTEKRKLLRRVAGYRPPPGAQESPEEELASKLAAVLEPTVEGEMAAIRSLGAPAGEEAEIEAILTAQQQGLEGMRSTESTQSVDEFSRHFDEARKLATEYGIANCTVTPEPNAPQAGDE